MLENTILTLFMLMRELTVPFFLTQIVEAVRGGVDSGFQFQIGFETQIHVHSGQTVVKEVVLVIHADLKFKSNNFSKMCRKLMQSTVKFQLQVLKLYFLGPVT